MLRSRTPRHGYGHPWKDTPSEPSRLASARSIAESSERLADDKEARAWAGRSAYTYWTRRALWRRRPRWGILVVIACLALCTLSLHRWRQREAREPTPPRKKHVGAIEWRVGEPLADALLDFEDQSNDTTARVPIPLVSREVLERLYRTEVEGGGEDADRDALLDQEDHRYSSPGQHRWPPIVTALPEARTSTPSHRHSRTNGTPSASTDTAIDAQFCGGAPCRLLVPLTVTEREPGKMQEQLVQIFALAKALNRTVVLPHAGKGRVGACLRWDFDTYFDIGSAVRPHRGRAMMMDDFRTWVVTRSQSPTARAVVVDGAGTDTSSRVEYSSTIEEKAMKNMRCFKTRFRSLDLADVGTTSVHLSERRPNARETAMLVNALSANEEDLSGYTLESLDDASAGESLETTPSDVLFLYWDLHHGIFLSERPASIEYSPRLWALAAKMTNSIQPYLAVHWHVDKVPAEVLPACADALVDTLDILLHDPSAAHDIRTIYFSSDFPVLELATSDSDNTQMKRSHQQNEAGKIIRAAFAYGGELEHWAVETRETLIAKVSTIDESPDAVSEDQLPLNDPGVQDMLDRIVGMEAALFVSSTKGCGRLSTAVKHVTDFRARAIDQHSTRNVADLFG